MPNSCYDAVTHNLKSTHPFLVSTKNINLKFKITIAPPELLRTRPQTGFVCDIEVCVNVLRLVVAEAYCRVVTSLSAV